MSLLDDEDLLTDQIVAAKPTVLCLGVDVPQEFALNLTRQVFNLAPTVEVIFVREPSAALWAQMTRVGGRDIVDPDSGVEEIATAIGTAIQRSRSVQTHVQASNTKERRQGRVIVILSPKGGSGKTTVSVNVAEAIAERAPGRTVLVDLDCQFGDVATVLGLEPERTLTDLGALKEMDQTAFKLFLTRTGSTRLFVLPSSGTPEEADLIDESRANEILNLARSSFDYVIVDTAAGIDERSLAAINQSTDLLFVASMDVTSIRNLMKELELLEKLGPSLQHRHFVLNRVDSSSGLKTKDIVAAVGLPISHMVDAAPIVVQNSNAGRAVVLAQPNAQVSKQLRAIGEAFLAEEDKSVKEKKLRFPGRKSS
ncbi:MAG: CpaE family protein [Actinomycetota bacterium]